MYPPVASWYKGHDVGNLDVPKREAVYCFLYMKGENAGFNKERKNCVLRLLRYMVKNESSACEIVKEISAQSPQTAKIMAMVHTECLVIYLICVPTHADILSHHHQDRHFEGQTTFI